MTAQEQMFQTGTAIIFLNQQWISHLAEILEREGLVDDTLGGLIQHAKEENRIAFQKLRELNTKP